MKKVLKRKRVFNGRLIKLDLEKQRYPNGVVVDLEVVKHPGAVLMVPFLSKERIVLISQYRPVISSMIWELPAGTLNKKEKELSCAKRELIEEIGYKASYLKKLGYIYPAPGYTTEKIAIYEARKLRKVKSEPEEDELIKIRIFSKKEVIKLLKKGKITDAKTICALKLAGVF